MLKKFRDFALKGNVVDLAIAVIIGAPSAKSLNRWSATLSCQ
jgi:large-conductance mechanosensitive channel